MWVLGVGTQAFLLEQQELSRVNNLQPPVLPFPIHFPPKISFSILHVTQNLSSLHLANDTQPLLPHISVASHLVNLTVVPIKRNLSRLLALLFRLFSLGSDSGAPTLYLRHTRQALFYWATPAAMPFSFCCVINAENAVPAFCGWCVSPPTMPSSFVCVVAYVTISFSEWSNPLLHTYATFCLHKDFTLLQHKF